LRGQGWGHNFSSQQAASWTSREKFGNDHAISILPKKTAKPAACSTKAKKNAAKKPASSREIHSAQRAPQTSEVGAGGYRRPDPRLRKAFGHHVKPSAAGQIGTAWRIPATILAFAVPDRTADVRRLAGRARGRRRGRCGSTSSRHHDEALTAKKLSAFWAPAGMWLGAAVVGAVATFYGDCMTTLAGERFLFRLRNSVFGHVQKLPLASWTTAGWAT